MREFAPKPNITNKKEIKETEGEIKINLKDLAEKISKYEPDSEEFLELKETFIKAKPAYEKRIESFIESEKDSDLRSILDSELSIYFKLTEKLDLFNDYSKELLYELFKLGDMNYEIAGSILEKRDFYKNKESENEKAREKRDKEEGKEDIFSFLLKRYGFSENETEKLIQSWLSVQDSWMARDYITKSLNNINILEDFEKGSAKYLFDNFGIRGFGRYKAHELLKQYKERDSMDPYGLYFQAVMDWNGSFTHFNHSIELREKVEDNSFLLRIIEAEGKIDLAKKLLSLRDKYDQKIKFMYMHAHGNTDVVGFGDKKGSDQLLLKDDLKGKGVQKVKNMFEDDAEVVLASCLAGSKGGLAEELANTYNVRVVASDKATTGEPKVEIKKNPIGNNLNFEIIFETEDLEDDKRTNLLGTVIYDPNNKEG